MSSRREKDFVTRRTGRDPFSDLPVPVSILELSEWRIIFSEKNLGEPQPALNATIQKPANTGTVLSQRGRIAL